MECRIFTPLPRCQNRPKNTPKAAENVVRHRSLFYSAWCVKWTLVYFTAAVSQNGFPREFAPGSFQA